MQVELSVSALDCDGVERRYKYKLAVSDTPLEQVEAHAKSMLAILDAQANAFEDGDDDDEGDAWKKQPPPTSSAGSPAS